MVFLSNMVYENLTIYGLDLLGVGATYFTAGRSGLSAYAATRVVGPSPPRSRESWCPRVRTVPDILFPQHASKRMTWPRKSLTGVQGGNRLGLETPETGGN